MAETTGISWADGTLNFWIGCTEVSNGDKGACVNCYARTWANRFPRFRDSWGAHAERVKTVNPLAKAKAIIREWAGRGVDHPFIFSNSLSDFFDNAVPPEWRAEAFAVMRATPNATYLLLTKRPQNIQRLSEEAGGLPPNAAIGFTAVTQAEMDRDSSHALAAFHALNPPFLFWSGEPLQERVIIPDNLLALEGRFWPITGGESGVYARPIALSAFRSVRDQATTAGNPYHHKQNGEWRPGDLFKDENFVGGEKLVTNGTSVAVGAIPKGRLHRFNDEDGAELVGKKISGREIDGKIHDARPEVNHG